ncbi:hypothetical protein [Paraburkholderia sp.]|uniref:hypothetical protein n=1 Tax=Paraburkholderia sp. TaxID=1926495 RepID=UPI0039E23BF0
MSKYALVRDGVVVNLTLWDGASQVDFGAGVTAVAATDAVQIGYGYDGSKFIAPAPQVTVTPIPSAQELADKIDDLVASIYSNWTRFQQEYLLREQAAQTFKDAGYTGDPGTWVSAYAAAAAVTNQAAADTILTQATNLNTALEQLGALRMRKYEVLNAKTADDAAAAYVNVVAAINAVAATIE